MDTPKIQTRQKMINRILKLFLRSKKQPINQEEKNMKKFLIAGLGNPGPEYKYTRHNIGFLAAEHLADDLGTNFSDNRYAQTAKAKFRGNILIIIKPQTFMNLSGKAVRFWLDKEKIPLENLLIITDDLNLPFGQIRLRAKGSDGGHNGLKNIIQILNTQGFARLRIGIGKEFAKGEQVDYVLGKWTEEEMEKLPEILDRTTQAVKSFVREGIQQAMTKYNRKK